LNNIFYNLRYIISTTNVHSFHHIETTLTHVSICRWN